MKKPKLTTMKKIYLLVFTLASFMTLQAQWTDDPVSNTRIANCANGAAEVYVSTDITTGDSYVQWHYQGENGWSPWLQRLDVDGVPQWPADGIHITTPDFATWSPGYSMTAVEGGVVSMFRTLGPHHWAVKVNADGTFPWGGHGIMLFDGEGGGRSEMIAGDDGGVWVLGTDMDNTFLQYVNADGTMRPMATITDPTKKCTNGKLIPTSDGVFVVYAKQTLQGYTNYNKEIYVAGYNKDGDLIVPETLLLGQQTVGASYVHYAISDGMGGGYVYQWHNGIGGTYNTYVTHFDDKGEPTITGPNGIPVHSIDPIHFYTNAYATVDADGQLIIAYLQTDAGSQTQDRVYVNCINAQGDKLWDDGFLVADYFGISYSDIRVDRLENHSGFTVIYGSSANTIEAVCYDQDLSETWYTMMSTSNYEKTISENTSGFHNGQNIVAWINAQDGGVFGQNIGEEGDMGDINIPNPPVPCCFAPENFEGEYLYQEETASFGAMLTWEAPAQSFLHYNLYRENLNDGATDVIEIDADATSYFDETSPSTYKYQLTAMYENNESEYALTPDGEDYIIIEVTAVTENETENQIVTLLKIYSANGQVIRNANIGELSPGIYIIQGLTEEGKLVTRKAMINHF